MTTKALIIVDWEKEWIDPKSEYYVGDLALMTEKMNSLVAFCRKNGYKIIFVKHIETGSQTAFVEDSESVEFIDGLDVKNSDVIIEKNKISPFYKTDLETYLNDIEDLVIAGILTNLCVRSTIHDAYDRDFSITVIQDCCQAFDEETHDFTISDLKATRSEIQFVDLAEFVGG